MIAFSILGQLWNYGAHLQLIAPPEDLLRNLWYVSGLLFVAGGWASFSRTLLWLVYTIVMSALLYTDRWITFVWMWESLSILSYFMVGHRDARNALLVNTFGGGALLLAGFPVLEGYAPLLILIGVLTKSSQWPFHRWIYQVAVAPSHISAFLHAATLVQAGVILLSRLQISDPTLDLGLCISAAITSLHCLWNANGKSLVVCSTQVFISCLMWSYTLHHAPMWGEIGMHMLYKPALFFTIHQAALQGVLWCIGLMHALTIVTCHPMYYMLPYMITGWKLCQHVYSIPVIPTGSRGWLWCFIGFNPLYSICAALADLVLRITDSKRFIIWVCVVPVCTLMEQYDNLLCIALGLLLSAINIDVQTSGMPSLRWCGEWLYKQLCKIDMMVLLAASLGWLVCMPLDIEWYKIFTFMCCCVPLLLVMRLDAVGVCVVLGWCATTLMGWYGAPDVMMTQVAVDALLLLYLLRNISGAHYINPWYAVIGMLCGIGLYGHISEIAPQVLPIPDFTSHLVNTVVSDKRALDTLGEICVYSLAGLALLQMSSVQKIAVEDKRFWGLEAFCSLIYVVAMAFLFRSECYGCVVAWLAVCAYLVVTKARFSTWIYAAALAGVMISNTHGHSGGFAAGVLLGMLAALRGYELGRAPYALLLITVAGACTQWFLIGAHGYWCSAWWFELGIAGVVGRVTRLLVLGARPSVTTEGVVSS
jgi:uncharacterized MnhB-related membrane protein